MTTIDHKRHCIVRLQRCIADLKKFNPTKMQRRGNVPEVLALEASIKAGLSAAFGHDSPTYKFYEHATKLDHGSPYTASLISAIEGQPEAVVRNQQAREARELFSEGKEQSISLLQQAIRTLEDEIDGQGHEGQAAVPLPTAPSVAAGGRPPADWWEDLLIDICFRHFRGELQAKTQAAIARAMQDWITERGYSAAESTVRTRARKVSNAIKRDAEN